MKILSFFLVSLCAFHILVSTLTVTEARPLPLILENWSNWLINIDPAGNPLLRPTPRLPPPAPKPNPPRGPGVSTDHPKATYSPNADAFASKLSEDSMPNQNTASA